MSVIHFGADELGNVAGWLILRGADAAAVIDQLATYSVGNSIAYERTYREATEPVSALEIARATNLAKVDDDSARGTFRLLSYNGIANDGRTTNMPGYFAAVAALMRTAIATSARAA